MPVTGRQFSHDSSKNREVPSSLHPSNTAKAAPVVLVHGFAQSARSWDAVAAALGASRSVATFELAGHGERRPSPHTTSSVSDDSGAYDLESQACALLDFLEGFEQRPVLVGYSMGGRVALQALVSHGERFASCVSALVLESCGLGPASKEERSAAAKRDAANAQRLREVGVRAFMDAWEQLPLFATQQELPADVRKHVRDERLANSAEALALTFERAGQHAMPSRAQVLQALHGLTAAQMPVLYLAGEHDEKYRALANELASNAGTTESPFAIKTAIVPHAGHNTHLEQPEAFCSFIEQLG